MDARQAAKALKLLRAKAVLPMHYKTFPLLAQDAAQFVRFAELEAPGTRAYVSNLAKNWHSRLLAGT